MLGPCVSVNTRLPWFFVPCVLAVVVKQCACVHTAGNCGNSGRLSKVEANLLKRYITTLQLFDKPEVQQRALDFVLHSEQRNHGVCGIK